MCVCVRVCVCVCLSLIITELSLEPCHGVSGAWRMGSCASGKKPFTAHPQPSKPSSVKTPRPRTGTPRPRGHTSTSGKRVWDLKHPSAQLSKLFVSIHHIHGIKEKKKSTIPMDVYCHSSLSYWTFRVLILLQLTFGSFIDHKCV